MTYEPVPGFEDLQEEWHEAVKRIADGEPDWSDLMPHEEPDD